jgi:predicted flap endonuclease-1-like 5' DNA nuclease
MNTDGTNSSSVVWGLAILAGVLAFVVIQYLAGYTFWASLLLAILIGVLVGVLLWVGIYRDAEDEPDAVADRPAAAKPRPATPAAATAPAQAQAAASATSTPAAKPKATPRPKAAPKPKTAAPKSPAKSAAKPAKPAAKASTAKPAAKASATPPVAKDGKPPTLAAARDGDGDDLKQLKGVGPALEKRLNELGFYHFDQIAAWRKKEIEWVDARLRFKGRIVRDGWVKQAKTLAAGGATDFSKRVDKGDVY